MDRSEMIVMDSESQDYFNESVGESMNMHMLNNPHHSSNDNDGHDIYYDRKNSNYQDFSLNDISYFQKDLKLSERSNSEIGDLFRFTPQEMVNENPAFSFLKSLSQVASENGDDDPSPKESIRIMKCSSYKERKGSIRLDESDSVRLFDVESLLSKSEAKKDLFLQDEKADVRKNDLGEGIRDVQIMAEEPKFLKNEGKLIFKIIKFDKVTKKERKCLNKTRRIITKCSHTSSKYYAKGMCKK